MINKNLRIQVFARFSATMIATDVFEVETSILRHESQEAGMSMHFGYCVSQ